MVAPRLPLGGTSDSGPITRRSDDLSPTDWSSGCPVRCLGYRNPEFEKESRWECFAASAARSVAFWPASLGCCAASYRASAVCCGDCFEWFGRDPLIAVGTRLGMGAVAELVCQACGAVSHSKVPRFRPDTMPKCPCGGRRQIVRIRHHGQPQQPTSKEESSPTEPSPEP